MRPKEIYEKLHGIGADLLVFSGMEYLLNAIRYFSHRHKKGKKHAKKE